jgi:hypothetical protein
MTEHDTNQPARPGLERHVQSAALTILMLLMGWVGNTLIAVDKRTAVIELQVGQLAAQVAQAQPAREAARDMLEVSRRLDALEAQQRALRAARSEEER